MPQHRQILCLAAVKLPVEMSGCKFDATSEQWRQGSRCYHPEIQGRQLLLGMVRSHQQYNYMRLQDAEAGSSPAQWRVVWLERENGGAGFSGNWAGFSKDQVQLRLQFCTVSMW